MPLPDHFRPPLIEERPWEAFHSTWATMIAGGLNRLLLPRYVALPLTSRGPLVEIDVTAAEVEGRDLFEIRVIDQRGGNRLAGAMGLVSPANKDRESGRQAFAGKCAGYLRTGAGLLIVDVVTTRLHDLSRQLLELLELDPPAASGANPLYAASYRTVQDEATRVEAWVERVRVGGPLPTMPLWLSESFVVPVDLEASHTAACELLGVG